MPVAFFDMDRTLLTVNSGTRWIRFLRRRGEMSRLTYVRALGWALQYKLAVLDMHTLSERLAADIAGTPVEDMVAKVDHWYRTDIEHTIAAPARVAIAEHRARGERIVLLTSATPYIADLLAATLGLDGVICTKLEVKDGFFTGKIERPICYGAGKVTHAEAWAEREKIDLRQTTFYSDSYTDLPMLERVGKPVVVNPDPRLLRTARRRGWPIVRWDGGGVVIGPAVDALIALALEEDLGRGDVTAESVFAGDGGPARAILLAKQELVVYGLAVVSRVFERIDPRVRVAPRLADGARVEPRAVIADLEGPATAILAGERTALNFLQRLSGVATLSARFAAAVAGTRARVIDTRKTTPGWRGLEKAAVRAGGCANHRADLGSGILIKDNHIAAAGGVKTAVERARAYAPHTLRIEVEVTTFAELDEAILAGAEIVLLDNMDLALLEKCIARARAANVLVEVSGNVKLDTVAAIARLGPDLISSGAITHSAPAVDISLEILS